MRERYLVRRFQPSKDMEGVYDSFVSGFHHILWPIIDQAETRLVEDIILAMHGAGDYTVAAEADGEARGILVGCFPFRRDLARKARALESFIARFAAGRYEMSRLARKCLWQVLYGYLPFLWLHPLTPSETLLLTSQREYRGGIGRAMMGVWIAETKTAGWRHSTVCTDSELSWDFYERYGFKRLREFPLKAYRYSLPEKSPIGYIYSLKW